MTTPRGAYQAVATPESQATSSKVDSKNRVPIHVTADELFKHSIPSEIKDAFMIQTLKDPRLNTSALSNPSKKGVSTETQSSHLVHGLATSGKTFQFNIDRANIVNPSSPMAIHGTLKMGHGTELKVTGERKETFARDLEGQRASFGVRSSHNCFTSDKGGETL